MAMDADARSLLASPAPSRPVPLAPTSRSGTPAPAASQAPSSAAAQSWSPPPKSTETPPSKAGGADPVSSATSHGERSSMRAIASGTSAVPRQVLRGIDHRRVGLVRQRQPRRVGAGGAGDEGGGPARDARLA